ncbi:MAG: hypothetical protein JSR49_17050 [Proteobacteria bacterium]|nr:hypothetical protein [Pseudomonadota bacterium]
MTFFKAVTMSAPLLEAPIALWAELMAHPRAQGGGIRESGAFLLGHKTDAGRVVLWFLPYEQLQPNALRNDYVSLPMRSCSPWRPAHGTGLRRCRAVRRH